MMNTKIATTAAATAFALMIVSHATPALAQGYGNKEKVGNIVEVAVANGSFTTLASLLQSAELVDALQGEGPFTVFAPTDEAFKKVPAETLTALGNDPKALKSVLLYHVVSGKHMAEKVVTLDGVKTLEGSTATIKVSEGKAFIGNAQIVLTDVKASNGVIHVIDTVLIPPARKDIVDTAVGAGSFTTLAGLLTSAGLVDALKGDGPFTVFAPTDEAFAKVPAETMQALGANPDLLRQVLLYHVVSGEVTAEQVVKLSSAKTLQGSNVTITTNDAGVKVDGANVVATDVLASNGVIHVIDSVILPPM